MFLYGLILPGHVVGVAIYKCYKLFIQVHRPFGGGGREGGHIHQRLVDHSDSCHVFEITYSNMCLKVKLKVDVV